MSLRYLIDIDHLATAAFVTMGSGRDQFRIGMSRMERVVRRRMASQDANDILHGL